MAGTHTIDFARPHANTPRTSYVVRATTPHPRHSLSHTHPGANNNVFMDMDME